jgi:hypothetical protein
MRILNKIAIAAVVVLVLVALTPVEAACGGNPLLKTRTGAYTSASFIWSAGQWDGSSYYPYYYTGYPPNNYGGVPPLTANAQATFWALGTGNPATGPGDDAGVYTFPANPWIYYYSNTYGLNFAAEIFTGWGQGGIDGCVQNNPVDSCTCLLITDDDGTSGYFALLSAEGDETTWNFDLVQPGNDGAGNFNPIILQRIPQPLIINSIHNLGQGDVELTVSMPLPSGPADGIYQSGGSCACGPTGYKIMQQVVDHGAPPPSSRQSSAWTPMTLAGGGPQGFTPMGDAVTVGAVCGVGEFDTYIATLLQFDSGFVSPIVSNDSTRISCSTLAEPDRPRFRPGAQRPKRERQRSR